MEFCVGSLMKEPTLENLEPDEYEQMSESDLTHIPSIWPGTCEEIKCLNNSFSKQNTLCGT